MSTKWNQKIGMILASTAFGLVCAEVPALVSTDFEKTADAAEWPAGWPKHVNATWETEEGNSFLRISAGAPGEMIMLYREINIPAGTQALELSFRQRVTGLQRGEQNWFDARIMMEWMDGDRAKVSPNPPSPNRGRDTDGWELRTLRFNVPPNARILKFMPALFRVNAGTFDLDDVVLRPVPAGE